MLIGNLTVKDALMLTGYNSSEADKQIKTGAWLIDYKSLVESLQACYFDNEELESELSELAEAYNNNETTLNAFGDIDLIVDDESNKIFLERCL